MKKLLPDIISALGRGERVVLVTVLEGKGSTPRKTGSAMAVFEDGGSKGTVGGGAIEFEAQRVAREEMLGNSEQDKTLGYSLSSDGLGDLCMICGGDVTLHFCVLRASDALMLTLGDAAGVADQTADKNYAADAAVAAGAATYAVSAGAERETAGLTLEIQEGVPTVITLVPDAGGAARFEKKSEAYDGKLTLPLGDAGRVFIFGGGHVGRALVPVLAGVGFNCVVFDDREEYARPEHFPDARSVVCGDFKSIENGAELAATDYVVVVTRGHKNDYEVLAQTLKSPARYVGCMGSKRKMAIIRERLRDEAGLSDKDIARLVAPIGLQIGAETPEELAVSVAAELIQVRAGA
jgi:xanthine dehydrogenase accessory factor